MKKQATLTAVVLAAMGASGSAVANPSPMDGIALDVPLPQSAEYQAAVDALAVEKNWVVAKKATKKKARPKKKAKRK